MEVGLEVGLGLIWVGLGWLGGWAICGGSGYVPVGFGFKLGSFGGGFGYVLVGLEVTWMACDTAATWSGKKLAAYAATAWSRRPTASCLTTAWCAAASTSTATPMGCAMCFKLVVGTRVLECVARIQHLRRDMLRQHRHNRCVGRAATNA